MAVRGGPIILKIVLKILKFSARLRRIMTITITRGAGAQRGGPTILKIVPKILQFSARLRRIMTITIIPVAGA